MLLQMLPDRVAKLWDELKPAFRIALPPNVQVDDEKLNNVLSAIIAGEMQVWCCGDKDGIAAIAATAVVEDTFSKERNLLIYTLFGYRFVTQELWQDGLETLKVFAHAKGCSSIIGYTRVPRVLEVVTALGGDIDNVLIRLEV